MAEQERRTTERLSLRIPIRVIGFETAAGDFTEDTETLVINQAGARITLQHHVTADDTIRIVNLDTRAEAEFRVVGATRLQGEEVSEWGVECTQGGHDVWGIELPPPLPREGPDAGALLECRACANQGFWPLTLMEVEVLDSTGEIARSCSKCDQTTYWTYADVNRRPRPFSSTEPVAPRSREKQVEQFVERRKFKRMMLRLPIFVRNQKGEEEISKTDNLSKGGVAVPLAMELQVGDQVSVECPYTSDVPDILQKAEVRFRSKFLFSDRRVYGLMYLRWSGYCTRARLQRLNAPTPAKDQNSTPTGVRARMGEKSGFLSWQRRGGGPAKNSTVGVNQECSCGTRARNSAGALSCGHARRL